MSDHQSNRLFRKGRYEEAALSLKKGLEKQGETGRDLLLYLLDLGLAYHAAGQYQLSNQFFLKADQVAEIKDYTSLAKETATILITDRIKDYRAEDFENVLISTYLAMNYALMGNFEDCLVEARRVNHKLFMMVSEGKRQYQQSAFARYFSAMAYEAAGNYEDASIDYQHAWKLRSDIPGIGEMLWKCAYELHDRADMERWDQVFQLNAEHHRHALLANSRSPRGEIVVIYENGISPAKRPNPHLESIPEFYPRFNPVSHARIFLDGSLQGRTFPLENIEFMAIENLKEKYAGLIAKKVGGLVAKVGAGALVGKKTNNLFLGFLVLHLLDRADQADLRSWNLLPKDLQIFRVAVMPGQYVLRISPEGGSSFTEKKIQVYEHKKTFVNVRYMP